MVPDFPSPEEAFFSFFLMDISKAPVRECCRVSGEAQSFSLQNWNPDKYAKHPSAVKTSRKTLEWSVYFSVFLSQSLSSQGRGKDVRIPLHYYSFFCPVGSKALIILGEGGRHRLAYRFLFYFFYCQPRWSQKRQLVARNHRLCESQKSHWKYSDHLSIYRIEKQAQMQSVCC